MTLQAKNVAILESRLGRQLVELPDLDAGAIEALVRSLQKQPAKFAVFQTGVGTRALFAATDARQPRARPRARGARCRRGGDPHYRWALPADTAPLAALIEALERDAMHAVVLTNAEQVRNVFAVARQLGREAALREAGVRVRSSRARPSSARY